MPLDVQLAQQRQLISQVTNELVKLKEQHKDFEDQQQLINTDTQQRLDELDKAIHSVIETVGILSLALAEQYEQTLAISDQQIVTMGAIADVYEEIMVYDDPAKEVI